MRSIWHEGLEKPRFPALEGDCCTDVLIVGGGLAGLLCGYMLNRAGVDCLIVEEKEIAGGVTRNTTAKITYHHGAIFDGLLRRFGPEKARLYLRAEMASLETYRALSWEIPCDFAEEESFVYSLDDGVKIQREVTALNALGCPAEYEAETPLPFPVAGAVRVSGQARFHPLKFAYALAKVLPIREHTRVVEITAEGAVTAHGKIRAQRVIVATHFPFIDRYGGYFLKLYQHRSYVLALKNAPAVKGMYVDEAEDGLSFRRQGEWLLLGGGGHRTGKPGGNWSALRRFAHEFYPEAQEVAHWATQDCKTLDDLPYVGRYSPRTPNWYVVTGFNKWGMTSAMTAARLLVDLVRGRENPLAAVLSPSRRILRPQLLVNGLETAKNLLTPTAPRCPHLGCALKYNPQEHSWDCACHGSRFSREGNVLDNPATKGLNP